MYKHEEDMPKQPKQGREMSGMGCHDFKSEAADTAYGQASMKGCKSDSKKIMSQMHHSYDDSNSGY